MNELSGGLFLLTASVYAGVSLLITDKINDILNLVQKRAKYLSALTTSFVLANMTWLIGSENMFSVLKIIGGSEAPPPEQNGGSLLYWNAIAVLSFLVSGGIYDWRKNKKA